MKRSITSGFLSIVSIKFLLIGLDFLSSPLLTRFLGAGYGDYAFLMSIFAVYMIFVSSGVGDGVRKYVAEERDRPYWDEDVVGFYLRLALILAAIGCFVLALGARAGFVTSRLGTSYRTYFYLLALLVFTSQFREYTRRTLMGFGLERYSEPLLFLDKILFIVAGVGLAFLGHGVVGVLVGHMIGAATTSVVGLLLINREISLGTALTRIPSREFPRRELFVFNGLSIVLILCLQSLYHVDVMMLGVLGTSQETAYYKISLTIAEFLWIVPLALQNVLLHSTSNIWSKHDRERINAIATRVTRYTLLFTLLLGIGLAALSPVALPLIYPDEYIASYVPILLLLPGCVGFALARPILAIGQGKGDLHLLIVSTGTAAVINAVLNGLLIPGYGMHGAAVATSIGYGSMFAFHVWSARKLGFYPVDDARIPQAVLVAASAAVPIFLLARFLGDSLLSLLVVPPVGAVVFLLLAIVFGAVDLEEILDILESAPDPVGSVGSTVRAELDAVLGDGGDADGAGTAAGAGGAESLEATPPATDDRSGAEATTAGAALQSESTARVADESGDAASRSNRFGEATMAHEPRSLLDDSADESTADGTRRSTGADAAIDAGSAPRTEVPERLETLESEVERQNERIEDQRQTLEQLIDELRRGR